MRERLIEADWLWKPEKKKIQTHQVQISELIWFDPEIYSLAMIKPWWSQFHMSEVRHA